MRLTTRTNLALRTLMVCAVNPDQLVRKSDVAAAVNASENHLAQVINQLGHAGFLNTQRGRHGGFTLARSPAEISVGAVFRAFEGDLPFLECFSNHNTCPLRGVCRLGGHIARAVEAFYASLDPLTLAELTECNTGLEGVLALDPRPQVGAVAGCGARVAELAG
jgi:Rrf2 family transcriptional regulator, nitric oxide-sensitive transcriptional repressor